MRSKKQIIPILLCIFIIINPFLFFYGIQNPFEFPKYILTIIVAQALSILLLLGRYNLKFDLLTKLIFIYLFVNLIANFLGLDLRSSLLGSPWRHQGFLLLLAGFIFYLSSRFAGNKIMIEKSILISGIFISIFTVSEFILLHLGANFPTYNGRITATMGNPNFLGAYLAMVLPFILFLKTKNKFIKPLSTILITILIFITGSRSAILSLFAVLLIYFINLLKINIFIKKLLILSSLIIFIFIFLQIPFFQRSSIWDTRSLIWNTGIEKIMEKPVLGYGQENFALIFPKELNFYVDNSHNIFLETPISSGIIGLLLFILILILSFRHAELKYKVFLVSYLITSFFNPLFISGIILFWIILGIANNKARI